ncbi:hypothetical protein CAPTEDRAFT_226161 [Capitella teleta]|uniref:Mre11 DNA-binding domain-containing protein n=1 Tax=Capitella teleta TaxID=283909 RepID=R7UIT5_CAPTE|nr:hypothetical protein CAPTEDRAFT_226161 [Capitella teleta]|eukprot:ELU06474.1 hypothetical protein CAPTEDRAFT_226161 [Capitella teleta]
MRWRYDGKTSKNTCSSDLYQASSLVEFVSNKVNFFGRYLSLEKIEVKPVLLKKGTTQLALYGLGSIRDERLHRMFVHNNIQFVRPKEDTGDWFNLFVIHQNRSKHGATNYIPEQFLANFLDLVFWGHEHECLIDPVWNSLQEFFVTQPGSPIATSLSKGETAPKHVGILKIRGKEMKIEKIPLETVRQFYFEELVLQDTSLSPDDPKCEDKVEKYCEEKVEEMLYQSGMERSGNRRQPKEPLIRLRVDYTGGFSTANPIKFGQKFIGRLANPRDILLFTHKPIRSIKDCEEGERVKQVHANIFGDGDEIGRAEELVEEFFKKADKKDQLKLLYVRNMTKAVTEYVEKEENAAIEEIVKCELRNCQKHIYNRITDMKDVTEEKVKGDLEMLSERKRDADDEKEVQEALLKAREKTVVEEVEEPEIISGDEGVSPAPTRGRGRGRGRGAGRGGGRGRGKKGAVVEATSMAAFLSKKSAETLHVISDSDDDFNSKPKGSSSQVGSRLSGSQRSRAPSGRTKRKAAFFDSDDSDDEVVIPKTKRKGR